MDKHDEQFEAFLREFQLRQPRPVPEMTSFTRRSSLRWVFAAAASVVLVVALTMIVRNSGRGHVPQATVEVAGNPSIYKNGQVIEVGIPVRSNSAQGLTLAFEDGSHVELRAQSELVLESAADGVRVRLNSGSILVTAAKQGTGHLYVQTRDALVSVVGTVFFVSTEQLGTRVGVLEGEVHVQQGAEVKRLHPGEQVATNPSIQLKSVAEEISWSQHATEYVAMLQQPGGAVGIGNSSPALAGQGGDAPELKDKEISTAALPLKVQAYYVGNGDLVRTLITVQIMTRDLAFQSIDGAQTAKAEIKGEISRIDNQRVALINHSLQVQFPSLKAKNVLLDKPNLFQENQYLAPGKYRLQLTVKDKNSQNVGIADTLLSVPRIPADTLQASSMILADSVTDLPPRSVGTEVFALGDKTVIPNITGVFRTDQDLNVWQEIYGLTVDPATGKPSANFELVISGNKEELGVHTNSTGVLGSGQKLTYLNSIHLGIFRPGDYDVRLKVTDNFAKVSFVTPPLRFSLLAIPTAQSDLSLFSRTCHGCHSVEAALNLGSRVSPFTASDRELLSSKQAELVRLLRIMTQQNQAVMQVQSEIDALQRREAAALNGYSTFVLRHLTDVGLTISGPEFPMLTRYLFEAVGGKKTEPPASSVNPIQQPSSPEAQGKNIFDRACTTCHNAAAAGSANYPTRNAYENLVGVERNKGAMISDAEVSPLVDYLFTTYGKKSAPTGDVPVQPAPRRSP